MEKKFVIFGFLASILIGSLFGIINFPNSFAEDNLSVSRENSDAYEKQLEKAEEERKKADERQEKAEEKRKELEEKKLERQEKAEEKRKELEEKKLERQEKAEEKRKKLEERKLKLEYDREKLEKKLQEKANKYEEKLKKIKERYQNRIESGFSNDVEELSDDVSKLNEKITKKTKDIREKLLKKSDQLDFRTQKILDRISTGDYLGKKIGSSESIENFELVFDSVTATAINDKTKTSNFSGFMSFSTYDKGKSNLKLELQECQISVDDIPYNCGFGKARSTSSGDPTSKNSLIILAFLEDDVIEEVHSTLKIFLNSDIPINEIDDSTQVSILGPQSKISGMWFLDGTGTLTKTISELDSSSDNSSGNEYTVNLTERVGIRLN